MQVNTQIAGQTDKLPGRQCNRERPSIRQTLAAATLSAYYPLLN